MTALTISGFDGRLVRPGDDGYEAGRAVWNAIVDRRPALIARCASTADVVAALRYGRERQDSRSGCAVVGTASWGCPWWRAAC